MTIRERVLPSSWYPNNSPAIKVYLNEWGVGKIRDKKGVAGIVPHAGWYYSGRLAAQVIFRMSTDIDTLIIAGGHLSPRSRIHLALEEGFNVPGGIIEADTACVEFIRSQYETTDDLYPDNTVEVQLPLVFEHWGSDIKIVWMRVPPADSVFQIASSIYDWGRKNDKKIGILGSTDLTHYGPSYGFIPAGLGPESVWWVKEENDFHIIKAMEEIELRKIIHLGVEKKAACSAGAAGLAAAWAECNGIENGLRLDYYTSYDVAPAKSFVGYCGILYQ